MFPVCLSVHRGVSGTGQGPLPLPHLTWDRTGGPPPTQTWDWTGGRPLLTCHQTGTPQDD